jgi:MFS family permease
MPLVSDAPSLTPSEVQTPAPWRSPRAWLHEQSLSRGFWIFFTAAFFFDAGFSVYFFLFNLFLLDVHWNQRSIGLIGGAFTLGSMAGTLPAGALARRIGLRPLLTGAFIAAPSLGMLRALWIWQPAQLVLAFLAGIAMCAWGVGYLPTVACLTTEKNRPAAFSLIYSVSIGTSSLGAVLCGDLPQWLNRAGLSLPGYEIKRWILLASCAIAAIGVAAVLRLRLPKPVDDAQLASAPAPNPMPRLFPIDPFLLRFLAAMALWSVVLAAFTPFANIYLSRDLHFPLARIGVVFAGAQILQLCAGLLNPLLFRAVGLVNGIVVTQAVTALALGLLAATHSSGVAVPLFLTFSAAQWMSSPGLYNLLMDKTRERERSRAASYTLFCNALVGSVTTAAAGFLFARYGYPLVLAGLALLALIVAVLGRVLMGNQRDSVAAQAHS